MYIGHKESRRRGRLHYKKKVGPYCGDLFKQFISELLRIGRNIQLLQVSSQLILCLSTVQSWRSSIYLNMEYLLFAVHENAFATEWLEIA